MTRSRLIFILVALVAGLTLLVLLLPGFLERSLRSAVNVRLEAYSASIDWENLQVQVRGADGGSALFAREWRAQIRFENLEIIQDSSNVLNPGAQSKVRVPSFAVEVTWAFPDGESYLEKLKIESIEVRELSGSTRSEHPLKFSASPNETVKSEESVPSSPLPTEKWGQGLALDLKNIQSPAFVLTELPMALSIPIGDVRLDVRDFVVDYPNLKLVADEFVLNVRTRLEEQNAGRFRIEADSRWRFSNIFFAAVDLDLNLEKVEAQLNSKWLGIPKDRGWLLQAQENQLEILFASTKIKRADFKMEARRILFSSRLAAAASPYAKLQFQDLHEVERQKLKISPINGEIQVQLLGSDKNSKIRLQGDLGPLLQIEADLLVNDPIQIWPDQVRAKIGARIGKGLLPLVWTEWPLALREDLKIDAQLVAQSDRDQVLRLSELELKTSSKWLKGDLRARTQASYGSIEAKGFIRFQLPKTRVRKLSDSELLLQGGLDLQFRLLHAQNGQTRIQIQPEFENFQIDTRVAGAPLRLEALRGGLRVQETLKIQNGKVNFVPEISWNPFELADPLGHAKEQSRQGSREELRGVLYWNDRRVGQFQISGGLEQNLLSIPQWSLELSSGELGGTLFLDARGMPPRIAGRILALNAAFSPANELRAPYNFKSTFDLDLEKLMLLGVVEWVEITPDQVQQILDFLDPNMENKNYNMVRSLLSTAYPTRMRAELLGSSLRLHLDTNLVRVPTLNPISIQGHLLQIKEKLRQTAPEVK